MAKESTYLKDENVLTLFSLNNLIVPEIQREYVWGNNSNNVLSNFLYDIKNRARICDSCHYAHSADNLNIGFLYSYKPPYVEIESTRFLDEYLIDGQQRITTIFLLLMCRSIAENRQTEFLNICRMDDVNLESCFKYKVRYLTQRFLYDLVKHAVKDNDGCLQKISQKDYPNWFLRDYRQDPTIISMVQAISLILDIFPQDKCYFDYLLRNIHFWHFKTEATSQGEELYITMNSRGVSLAGNEMMKAKILPPEKQIEYGQLWENWQQFFWKHRGINENADKGFNEYIACIEGLERYRNPKEYKGLTIDHIIPYFDAIRYLFDDLYKTNELHENLSAKIKSLYPEYYNWFDYLKKDILEIINEKTTDWKLSFDEKKYNNQSVERNRAVLMWSWMYYYKLMNIKGKEIDVQDFLRVLHLYYIKYHVYNRGVKRIWPLIESFVNNGYMKKEEDKKKDEEGENDNNGLTEEEIGLEIMYYQAGNNRNALESIIWNIQDISYIKDGKEVGADTIGKYLDIIIDEESARSFLYNINMVLPETEDKQDIIILLKRCLLFYVPNQEPFCHRSGPWYYDKYETSEWKRIFRSLSFHLFYEENFKERINGNQNIKEYLEGILNRKRVEFFKNPDNCTFDYETEQLPSHQKLTILYDMLDDKQIIWKRKYIAYCQEDSNCLRFYKLQRIPYSMANTFHGKYELIELPTDWQNKLQAIAGVEIKYCNYPKPE